MRSHAHGHVQAVALAMRRLGLASVLASQPSRERDLVLAMVACYVEWHMRQAWSELLFADTDSQARATRDPVAPAQRSAGAQRKAQSKVLDDALPVHSFATLMAEMATLVRNSCRTPNAGPDAPTFEVLTSASAHQQRAMALLQAIQP